MSARLIGVPVNTVMVNVEETPAKDILTIRGNVF